MSAAASVVSANSARRDLVRLVTTDGADSGFGSGTVHLHALLEHLAVIDATGSASLRTMLDVVQRDGQGALVLVVGDTVDDELTSTARLRQRFGLVLIVRAARADHAERTVRPDRTAMLGGTSVVRVPDQAAFAAAWNASLASARSGRALARSLW